MNEDNVHGNRTDQDVTDTVIEFSMNNPHLGQVQVSNHLRKHFEIDLSATGVRNIWLREHLQTIALRMQKQSELQDLL